MLFRSGTWVRVPFHRTQILSDYANPPHRSSAVISLGASTLADIYDPHERGTMMGIYYWFVSHLFTQRCFLTRTFRQCTPFGTSSWSHSRRRLSTELRLAILILVPGYLYQSLLFCVCMLQGHVSKGTQPRVSGDSYTNSSTA